MAVILLLVLVLWGEDKEIFVIIMMVFFFVQYCKKPSLSEGPGKVRRLYLISCGFTGLASWRHSMEEQVPLNLSYGPNMFRVIMEDPSCPVCTYFFKENVHLSRYQRYCRARTFLTGWNMASCGRRRNVRLTPTVLVGNECYDQHGGLSPIT